MDDPTVQLIELDPHHVSLPAGASSDYTIIEVSLFAGRSLTVKRALYGKLFAALGALGVRSTDVLVLLTELPMDNWGVRGGVPASEVDIGFRVRGRHSTFSPTSPGTCSPNGGVGNLAITLVPGSERCSGTSLT